MYQKISKQELIKIFSCNTFPDCLRQLDSFFKGDISQEKLLHRIESLEDIQESKTGSFWEWIELPDVEAERISENY